jgi:hypothetical protein
MYWSPRRKKPSHRVKDTARGRHNVSAAYVYSDIGN